MARKNKTQDAALGLDAGKTPRAVAPPTPSPSPQPVATKTKSSQRRRDYGSIGVKDHDIFLLPLSDYQIVLAITVLAAVVRLFRIYQPTSVVFDEVQYVKTFLHCSRWLARYIALTR